MVKVGDKVKIKSSQIQYGIVQEIVAQGRQSDGYRGQGWFLLKRYPEEIYRDDFRGYPMSRLTQKGGNGKVSDDEWKVEMKKQSAHLPARLELYHWASPNPKTVRVALLRAAISVSLLRRNCAMCGSCRVKWTFQSRASSTNCRAHL